MSIQKRKYKRKELVLEAYQTDEKRIVDTLEGRVEANPGDYIITGIIGEEYICREDIFYDLYTLVENDDKY